MPLRWRAYEAQLVACHCMDPARLADESARAQTHRQLEGLIDEFNSDVAPSSFDWQGWVIEGDPTVDITKEAALLHVDLIVMQSRRRPVAAAIFGSTAEAICRETHSNCLEQDDHWLNQLPVFSSQRRVYGYQDRRSQCRC
jgi:nucleotide-binding universal stress UspA family protein